MKSFLLFSLIGVYSILAEHPEERRCGSKMENLWLDVVLVVDNSKGMTKDGLTAISANLASIFSDAQIGINPSNPKTTRIGMVTYNSNATVDAHLNYDWPKNNDIQHHMSTFKGTGKDDPIPVANRLKGRGVKILTIAYDQGDEKVVEELAKISSPGLSFKQDANMTLIENTLLEVNCFCPSSNWYQYRTPGQSYGTCIQPVGMSAVWFAALASCQLRWNTSYLASEFTLDKHQFVFEIVKRTPQIREPYAYHIGLRRIDGEWYWDQPTGLLPVRDYKNWGYDYPKFSKTDFPYVDRECGQDLTNLWLDVVAVVDNSIGMTDEGLDSVAANLASVFSAGTRIGTSPSEPRTTRLGLVTYNSRAQQNADLNKFQSLDDLYEGVFGDLARVSTSYGSLLSFGLQAAENLFNAENLYTSRSHFQKVVVIYASSYRGTGEQDPLPVANRLKTSGVRIITVAYDQGGDGTLLRQLSQVASPGFNFSSAENEGNIIGQVQGALLESNCFCPNDWIQYRQFYSDTNSYRYGVCFQPVTLTAVW
ncbi:hypothetical protein L3Y34_016487 [Caenorhabditis briggsae]|uniref:VWFA domain-containing protein n=1 Tax=Caenorhabditis briggsae TaxID=6238 RepID=A0AAE9J157_CAEBR|nr:hypothetical protein L3Y34_016487 [Caenorhabditis briggsae]